MLCHLSDGLVQIVFNATAVELLPEDGLDLSEIKVNNDESRYYRKRLLIRDCKKKQISEESQLFELLENYFSNG
jgi:hypothetical protein